MEHAHHRRRNRRNLAASAGALAAVIALLTGCSPDGPAELAQPTPLDGLVVTASYELEPVESRSTTEDEADAATTAHFADSERWPELNIPLLNAAFLDENEESVQVVRLDAGGGPCSTRATRLEALGDAGIRITYEGKEPTGELCAALGVLVVDDFDLPKEVTGRPITVELVGDEISAALLTAR